MADTTAEAPAAQPPAAQPPAASPPAAGPAAAEPHPSEPHAAGLADRLNWLRAGVLGANDGIVSVAAIVVGVAGATASLGPVLTAGAAGLVGGAVSMALGEYVSVSSQRDSEHALIEKERRELEEFPHEELAELSAIYEDKGLSPATARRVAEELTANDALGAHLAAELNIDPNDIVSPWRAAAASALAFVIGGLVPLVAILLAPRGVRVPITVVTVLPALALTGAAGAYLGQSALLRPTLRVVLGGGLALAATFAIGRLLGTAGLA